MTSASHRSESSAAPQKRDHGGGLDAAIAQYGGSRSDWVDLSTGINPIPYPLIDFPTDAWTALPDHAAISKLTQAARRFWNVPANAEIVPSPGASALIARIPAICAGQRVRISGPTYNEHAAAFQNHGWQVVTEARGKADVQVLVHPNNPDGHLWADLDDCPFTIIDESFCDVTPDASKIDLADCPGTLILKSFGKFWGLAGLRLGFAIGHPRTLANLAELIGPWPVAGPALAIGAAALDDFGWAASTRQRLKNDAARLDAAMSDAGARAIGGTTLFRLYDTDEATAWQHKLATGRVWSRIFPYSANWLRLGLPHPDKWDQILSAIRDGGRGDVASGDERRPDGRNP